MTRRMAALAGIFVISLWATSATAEGDEEGWSGDVGLSFTAQTGTVDTIAGTLDAKTTRTWENDVVGARLNATVGISREKDGNTDPLERGGADTIADAQGAFGTWKHSFTERFFLDSRTELSRDGTQDRNVRFAAHTGPGLRVWAGEAPKKEHFDLSAGVGYRYEVYDGNDNDAGTVVDTRNLADLVAAFEYKNLLFDGKIEYTHTGTALMPANDINNYILRTEITLGVPLTKAWDLRAGFLAEYVKVTPDPNNELTTRTTIGLAYKF